MAGIGELLLGITGATNPRERLLAAMGGQGVPAVPGGDGTQAGAVGAPGAGAPPQAGAAPQGTPPQPQAYQSPPDLAALYAEVSDYGRRSDNIDRSFNTLLSGISTNDDHRRELLAAANGVPQRPSDPAGDVSNIMRLRMAQQDISNKAAQRAALPEIAKKYGLDIKTATYLFDSGGLDNVIARSEAQRAEAAGGPRRSLSPVYGVDASGNTTVFQLGDDGTIVAPKLPEGYSIARDPVKVDAGTEWILLDPQTRQPVGRVPKDVAGEALAKGRGTAQAEAETKLPGVETMTSNSVGIIDSILDPKNDKVLDALTGADSYIYKYMPGEYADVQSKIDQLTGASFLQSMENLRGTGQITEIEGKKATDAIARLNQAQTKDGFRAALSDLKRVMGEILGNAKRRASGGTRTDAVQQGGALPAAAPAAPAAPVDDILKKYGIQ